MNNLVNVIQYLNHNLVGTTVAVKSKLSLRTDIMPTSFDIPVVFMGMFALFLLAVLAFANSILCNLLGVLYPLFHGFNLFHESNLDMDKITTLNKYWMIFGSVFMMENFFGCIMMLIPGYYYFKIIGFYLLVRNDFMLSNVVFDHLLDKYHKSYFYPRMKNILNRFVSNIGNNSDKCTNDVLY